MTNEVRLDAGNAIDSNGEQHVQQAARTVDRPVVFDVGAHHGEWTTSLLQQPGSPPDVHCFEPSAATRATLLTAVSGRATVHPLGLSDQLGAAELVIVHEGAGSNSLVPFADTDRASGATETVQLSTVDQVADDLDVDRITLLKIDAEGHDLAVIRGAARRLDRQAIDLVQFEYNHRWIDARAFLADAFADLQPRGYHLGKITPRGVEHYPSWHHELEKFVEGNYLAWLPSWSNRLRQLTWWNA